MALILAGMRRRQTRQLRQLTAAAERLASHYGDGAPPDDADARHAFRNELGHIAGPAQLLLRRETNPLVRGPLERIVGLVNGCVALLDQRRSGTSTASVSRLAPAGLDVAPTGAHILVAEDDEVNRRFLCDVLSDEGHTVTCVGDGDTALRRAENDDIDLVLLDLGLPGISGFELLERLRADGWRTPVIVVTGRGGVDDAVRCIKQGAEDFLTKPTEIEILHARVSACINTMRLREREIGQFFPPKLARTFARRPKLIEDLPGKHADVSVLFCDIRNFTATSERLGPEKTTTWLRAVMHELSECVIANEGVLVDFAGDELMAMWGAPEEIPDHATRAGNTAVEILRRLPVMSAEWQTHIGGDTDLAIGINTGRAMVGHIGTARKTKYGALGMRLTWAAGCWVQPGICAVVC